MTDPTPKYSSRRLFAGDFPELQSQFFAEVAATRARDPLAPLIVLVPGHLAGLHLRRELAWSDKCHANIRFYTLTDYARELALPILAERGLRMLPEVARGPLMKRAIETCGKLNYFSRMAGRAGFRHAVWATIHELRASGLSTDDLERALKQTQMDEHVRTKLADIAVIWRAYDRILLQHKLADRTDLLDLAALTATSGCELVIYGLDDFSYMERRLLELRMRGILVTAYLPFRASDAYAWTEPLYIWYLEQGFEAELLDADERNNSGTTLARMQTQTFEDLILNSTMGGETVGGGFEHDKSFLVISAPSRDTEVEEILREVLYSPFAQDSKPNTRAVLMRESANYLGLMRSECKRAGITGYFHECRKLAESSSGRALHGLTKLLDGTFRRSDVMEFLLSSPLRPLAVVAQQTGNEAIEVPAAEWNHLSMQAQIIAGEKMWKENLVRLRNRLTAELERREWEADDPTTPLKKKLASLAALESYVQRLFAGVRVVREAKSWREFSERMAMLFTEFVESSDDADAIREELARAGLLDLLGLKPDPDEFAAFVESLLSLPVEREGRFQVHEPAMAKISDALGVVFDEVYICGLVEKEFPRAVSQDPLLLDDERQQLQHALFSSQLDLQIPLRGRRRLREKFLFRMALNSARQRVVLTYPRMDPVEGREWLPSTFLLRAVEAATGESTDYESLERFVRTSPRARRVPVNRLQGRHADTSVTLFQYDLARLGSALQTQSAENVADLFCADEFFKRGVEAERRRYRERRFTPFDGCIENEALKERLTEWISRLSPSRIESYLSCPFQYFITHLLELEQPVEPRWIQPVDSRARGMLAHDILEKFYRTERQAGRLPLQPDAWKRLEDTAHECITTFERDQVPGLFLLWDIERTRLMKRLRTFFATELERATSFIPRYFNVGYGVGNGDPELSRFDPVSVTLDNGHVLQLRGKLDRVDVDEHGAARIVDYTTSKNDKRRDKDQSASLKAHAARLAAEALGLKVDSFEHYFLGPDETHSRSIPRESLEQDHAGIMQQIQSVAEHIASGSFYPIPSDGCSSCCARVACGSGRFTRKWDFESPQLESLRILRGGKP